MSCHLGQVHVGSYQDLAHLCLQWVALDLARVERQSPGRGRFLPDLVFTAAGVLPELRQIERFGLGVIGLSNAHFCGHDVVALGGGGTGTRFFGNSVTT